MRDYRIAVIPGDGIGNEVVPEAIRVLDAAGEITGAYRLRYEHFPWGCEYYLEHGAMMAADGLETLRRLRRDLLRRRRLSERSRPRLAARPAAADLPGLRAVRVLPALACCCRASGARSPASGRARSTSWSCARTPRASTRARAGGPTVGLPIEVAVETAVFTRTGVERVVRYAFELAQRRRKRLVSATKSNAQRYAMTLWDEVAEAVAASFPTSRWSACWSTRWRRASCSPPSRSTWWWPATCSATS